MTDHALQRAHSRGVRVRDIVEGRAKVKQITSNVGRYITIIPLDKPKPRRCGCFACNQIWHKDMTHWPPRLNEANKNVKSKTRKTANERKQKGQTKTSAKVERCMQEKDL